MTGYRRGSSSRPRGVRVYGMSVSGAYSSEDLDMMQGAIDAVCEELGIGDADGLHRDTVARRIIAAYETGRRAPLYLVDAGLGMR